MKNAVFNKIGLITKVFDNISLSIIKINVEPYTTWNNERVKSPKSFI
jgi:hypothetical protein